MFLNKLLEGFYRVGARLLVRIVYSCDFEGFENIPATGPVILIANHTSYMDGMVLNAACKRPIRFVIDEDIYNQPFINYFMKMDKAIPIKANKGAVTRALAQAKEALENGDVVMIFPEGLITYSGYMSRFKFGVEWILKTHPTPVIPIALIGLWGSIFSRKYLGQKYRYVPRFFRKKVKVICGEPVAPKNATINNLQRTLMKMYEDNV